MLQATPLLLAWRTDQNHVVKYLLDRLKTEELETRAHGYSCLMGAAQQGNVEAIRRLLILGADTQASCNDGHTALCFAVEKGHVAAVKCLLAHAKFEGGDYVYEALLNQPCACREGPLLFCAINQTVFPWLSTWQRHKESRSSTS